MLLLLLSMGRCCDCGPWRLLRTGGTTPSLAQRPQLLLLLLQRQRQQLLLLLPLLLGGGASTFTCLVCLSSTLELPGGLLAPYCVFALEATPVATAAAVLLWGRLFLLRAYGLVTKTINSTKHHYAELHTRM